MIEDMEYPDVQLMELLGRLLNDIESKFAPKKIFCEGPMKLPLPCPRVSIIGSRNASEQGLVEAKEISKRLIENNVTIVSGLAKGIDTVGHKTAIKYGGKTIAVIGTPLNKVYPKENAELQDEIMKNHLVVSQYPVGHNTTPKDFVLRNRTMALISDATVIVEAGDSSGSLHQGWETLRIGRPLFISKSVVHNDKLEWPGKMIKYGAMELNEPSDILENLPSDIKMPEIFQ
ncbi:MAG: DNA-protecting protein DprA [Nitrosopumilus sp.]|nr:DNA-protecting protein DprA [Nitrosopumilus sp.]